MMLLSISQQLLQLWRDGLGKNETDRTYEALRMFYGSSFRGYQGIHRFKTNQQAADLRKVCMFIIFKQKIENIMIYFSILIVKKRLKLIKSQHSEFINGQNIRSFKRK